MRRKHLLWIAPWIVLGLSACATSRAPRPDLRTDVAKACAEWRWIGIKRTPEAHCPDLGGWTVRPLFSVKGVQEEAAVHQTPARAADYGKEQAPYPDPSEEIRELNRFCLYEADPDRRPGDLPFPPAAAPELVRFDQDCAALSSTGDEVAAADWERLSELFLAQAGRPPIPLRIRNRQGVRLAFLDTQPTGVGVPLEPGSSEHGYTLAHIARHLVCSPADSDDCAAQITTRLALPVTRFDARDRDGTETSVRGGHIGMQSDLAEAIQGEVDDWQAHLRRKGWPEHLVLNLSLGWDGRLFGGLDEKQVTELRAGSQAVYRALRYAARFDALVLAAAGNARNCPGQTEGPLLPAAWETEAPPEESCGPGTPPLLYAVGGVDAAGHPLVNARHRGMPRRAAYGENGIVADWEPGRSTMMYTGSSVATAVASSIAAIVWDTVPTLSSRGVMDLLEEAPAEEGEILPLHADFWAGSTAAAVAAPPVRKLSLCTALSRACEHSEAVNCPLQSPCGTLRLEQARLQPPAPVAKTRLRSCHPWIVPQPEADPCPVCKPPRE